MNLYLNFLNMQKKTVEPFNNSHLENRKKKVGGGGGGLKLWGLFGGIKRWLL